MYARVFLLASLLVSLVAGVDIPGLPKCAGDCVGDSFGGCQQLNVQCICSNNKLLTHLSCCVSKNCSKSDQDKTIKFAQAICKGEQVTDLPTTATCASTATGSSATGSSSTGTSGGAMTTGTGSSMSSTTPAAAQASSSQGAAVGYEKVGRVGLGVVVAGLVAAI